MRYPFRVLAVGLAALACTPALATFHFMQIEQVIGGVNGDTTAQAIQLRMRSGGQHEVAVARVRSWDAAGANPIIVCDMTTDLGLAGSVLGARILITTDNFPMCPPSPVRNFAMTAIPAARLAAGSLTFEDDGGTIYWRVSWGGAGYTGLNTGDITNDADGNFGPPFAGPLPSSDYRALLFQGAAADLSTNNAAQYALSSSPATFTNYTPQSFRVDCVPTVSEWGLIAMTLMLLAAGSVVLLQRRTRAE